VEGQAAIAMSRRSRPSFGVRDAWLPYVILGPLLLIMAAVVFYPAAVTLWNSLHRPELGSETAAPFVGLANYLEIVAPGSPLWSSVFITAQIIAISLPIELIIGLAGALVLNQSFRGRGLVRTLVIIPWVLPPIVNGFMWNWLLNGDLGALNGLLYQLGIISEYQHWLTNPTNQVVWTSIAESWTRYAFVLLVLLAGLQAIPLDIYDAARIDGANAWQTFRRITFPLLLPSFTVVLVIELIFTIQIFDVIWSITGGGSAGSSINPFTKAVMVLNYEVVFRNLNLGLGSALAYVLLLLSLGLGFLFVRLLARKGTR
jgi:multiple sugar transport system permease protein